MLFKYKINLNIEFEFDTPLLGADTTKAYRSRADMIAKATLAEMVKFKTTSYVGIDRGMDEDGLKGIIKGDITLRTAKNS
jgi:hypothetical protein